MAKVILNACEEFSPTKDARGSGIIGSDHFVNWIKLFNPPQRQHLFVSRKYDDDDDAKFFGYGVKS